MENLSFEEASSKLEKILDELENEDDLTNKQIENKVNEATSLKNYCKKKLKQEKENIIKIAKENNISLEDIGVKEGDDDDDGNDDNDDDDENK
jgi:exonuclease VII small subunit